jgi:tripartite ATP-independent transporter DctM subunit
VDITIITLIIWVGFLVLMTTGMPVAFSMIVVGVAGYALLVSFQGMGNVASLTYDALNTELYVAIPLFVLMAQLLVISGLSARLYQVMHKWMGGLSGGLAIGTTLVATVLGATTGLVATATITMGMLAYPEMEKRGYDKTISIGTVLSGGALGLLIPPSLTMILIGNLIGLSVGKLFIAGLIPGLLCSFIFCLYAYVCCKIDPRKGPPIPLEERATWKEKFACLPPVIPAAVIILVVLGGIWLGVFTATEAGGIGAAASLAYTAASGNLSWQKLKEAGNQTIKVTAMVLWITIGGVLFTSLNSIAGTDEFLSKMMAGWTTSPEVMLIILMVISFILGTFMDLLAQAIVSLPIMMPIVIHLNIDPLFFGFCFAMSLIIGTLSPPYGYTLFYFAGLKHKNVTMKHIFRAGWVYTSLVTIVLVLCLFFPQIALWLPNRMIR